MTYLPTRNSKPLKQPFYLAVPLAVALCLLLWTLAAVLFLAALCLLFWQLPEASELPELWFALRVIWAFAMVHSAKELLEYYRE